MRTFLDEIADAFVRVNNISALKRCIITPNRRASRFIKKAIMERNPDGGFLPQIFSIDEFIFSHIKLIKLEEVDLTFHLFDVMLKQNKEEKIEFEDFLKYSSTLLHDFNEIDMNMTDGKQVFSYLSEAKAIQQWNPDGSPLSTSQKEYLSFFQQLAFVYEDFRDQLFEEKSCYQGMGYRYFSENIDSILDQLKWDHMIIAGFNALTTSEEMIIKKLENMPITDILWDVDEYYLNDPVMEAGYYLQKHRNWSLKVEQQAAKHFKQTEKSITITGSPGVLGQARLTSQLLESMDKSALSETVIVPADENLLLPLLNNLPKELLLETNITMGFPITHSHAYRLMEAFLRLHIHAQKLHSLNPKNFRLHKLEILEVLNNELLQTTNENKLVKHSSIPVHYVGTEMMKEILEEMGFSKLQGLFINHENEALKLNDSLIILLNHILNHQVSSKENPISEQEIDALLQIKATLVRLSKLILKTGSINSFQTYFILYKQLIKNSKQSFVGKYDKGLQLMGLLETRLMDFKNVILISANEDILPASTHVNSFISSDIRHEKGLPGIQERTAVFAYHFYRLIQRAKNIEIIYSTTKKKLSGGEKSRFLKQLEFELPKYNGHIKIKESLLNFDDLKPSENVEIIIQKNEQIIEKLYSIADYGLSPTSIINYVKCPLKFYFERVAGIKEPEFIEESIDGRMIGTVIHHLLEDFYKPYIGSIFPTERLKDLHKELPELVKEYFLKNDFKGQLEEGANYLSYKNTLHYLQQFIKHEIKVAKKGSPLKIIAVEDKLEREIDIPIEPHKVKIRGIADRIDFYENELRILDYKTGKVEEANVKIPSKKTTEEINKIFSSAKYDKALQLYIYDWMYPKHQYSSTSSGIISFGKIKSPYLMLKTNKVDFEELNKDFEFLVAQIFHPNIPFTQTSDNDTCRYCIYKQICSKNI